MVFGFGCLLRVRADFDAMNFSRSSDEGLIAGVCAGLAYQFALPIGIVRIAAIAITVFGFGLPILLYLYFMRNWPKRPTNNVIDVEYVCTEK